MHIGLGFTLFLAGALVWIISTRYGSRDGPGAFARTVWILLLAGNQIIWLGAWWFTAQPDVETCGAKWLRYGFRTFVTIWLVCDGVFLLGQVFVPGVGFGIDLGLPRLWSDAIATVLGFAYLANLAARCGWWTARRVSLLMCLAAVALVVAAAQKTMGVYTPRVLGVALPFPLQPMLGSVEDHHHLNQFRSWPTIERVKKYLPGLLWLACSFATMLWFAIRFLMLAAGAPGKTAANFRP